MIDIILDGECDPLYFLYTLSQLFKCGFVGQTGHIFYIWLPGSYVNHLNPSDVSV